MPTENQANQQATGIPNPMPESTRTHGENPARYLVQEISVDAGDGTSGELIEARIRGIATIELCRFWLGVERYLSARDGRDPRDTVVDALEDREETLRKRGEGLATSGLSKAERKERASERDAESVAVLLDGEGNERSWSSQATAGARLRVER